MSANKDAEAYLRLLEERDGAPDDGATDRTDAEFGAGVRLTCLELACKRDGDVSERVLPLAAMMSAFVLHGVVPSPNATTGPDDAVDFGRRKRLVEIAAPGAGGEAPGYLVSIVEQGVSNYSTYLSPTQSNALAVAALLLDGLPVPAGYQGLPSSGPEPSPAAAG
ncbi:hypothetical protein N825_25300 [Skermanella stibiiresistens SB22]|uniref:Uncharacterized protein n=1 Tax=Skermanella stibiiresistens SB22 TaxID=1385369 RepID=W9GZ48_9PROT|nr:hypothetical protein [Skermanella stibiiresistens]EWY36753.1 hypothetical protein N825_25300 [Skermanella stibiiresistens SB22]